MWSVPSRLSDASTSRTIQRRELPCWFGSSPIAPWNFVASTTSSRRPPASALPTISSDSPREYTSAVSMKLIPASSARWMIRIESSRSVLPHAPNIIAPRHSGLTSTPVRPSALVSMLGTLRVGGERPDQAVGVVGALVRLAVHEEGGRAGHAAGDRALEVIVEALGEHIGTHVPHEL